MIRWQRTLEPGQSIEDSDTVSKAAPTPVVDEHGIYAFFETGNLAGYDHQGTLLWQRKLTEEYGEFSGRHGMGSSLNRTATGVVALVANDGPSYLLCVDPKTGKSIWKTPRPAGMSWSTPAVIRHEGREVIVVSGGDRVEAFAPEDGRGLWVLDGLKGVFLPSPTGMPGGAIIGSSEKGQNARHAVSIPRKRGTRSVVACSRRKRLLRLAAGFSRQGLYGEQGERGILPRRRHRRGNLASAPEGQCWASPIGAGDRVYFFSVEGVTQVLAAGNAFEVLAENVLEEEGRVYGVAVSDNAFFVRYGRSLVRIATSRA